MEPERKIEKLLRAYAQKCRAAAGDPLKLHPATRRLLQAEVARRRPGPDDETEASVSLWELFRRSWALLAVFALVIFFGAALFLPPLSTAKKKSQSVTAVSNLKQIGVAAQLAANENLGVLPVSLDTLTNELGTDKILTDPETGQPFIYLAGGEKLGALSSNDVLAYSAAEKQGRAVLFADGRVEVVNGTQLDELTRRASPPLLAANESARREFSGAPAPSQETAGYVAVAGTLAGQPKEEAGRSDLALADKLKSPASSAPLAVNAPAPATPPSGSLARSANAADRVLVTPDHGVAFANTTASDSAANLQNSFKNTVVQTTAPAVLANFEVQQSGNAIRVVDADGSVYTGELQREKSFAQSELVKALPPGSTVAQTPAKDQQKFKAGQDESQLVQNYPFLVSGTNLTLQQKVVFVGNLVENSSAQMNRQQLKGGSGGGNQRQAAPANQLPWSNARITGTAVVAATNHIEILAVPQAP